MAQRKTMRHIFLIFVFEPIVSSAVVIGSLWKLRYYEWVAQAMPTPGVEGVANATPTVALIGVLWYVLTKHTKGQEDLNDGLSKLVLETTKGTLATQELVAVIKDQSKQELITAIEQSAAIKERDRKREEGT